MLTEGDDIYLLRLMVQTGSPAKHLDQATFAEATRRLNKIVRVGIFEQMVIDWIDDARDAGHLRSDLQQTNEFLDTLFQVGRAEGFSRHVNVRAEEVYDLVVKDLQIAHANQSRMN